MPISKNYIWFENGRYEKGDTISKKKYWRDNKLKIEYKNNGVDLIRFEYFRNGKLKCKTEITQDFGIDTTSVFNPKTNKEEIVIYKTLIDRGNGNHEEYNPFGKLKCKGKSLNSMKVGEWVEYDINGNKIIANYNNKGEIEGKYFEYYYNRLANEFKIKVEGQFKIVEYKVNGVKYFESRRTGNWKYFSKEGLLIEESKYIN
ncbi:MAG: hypothetical protein HKN51_00165 [Saprospiraceae bacterium]|nr:hypothetical protein [Saprospiraceae bacterium]